MKKIIFSIALVVALSPVVGHAAVTGVSFGGIVTAEYTCNTGLLLYLKSATPPYLVLPVMWFWGELPYSSYIPPHPGQQLLGMTEPTPVPCVLGYVPIGAGLPIIFHGSSL